MRMLQEEDALARPIYTKYVHAVRMKVAHNQLSKGTLTDLDMQTETSSTNADKARLAYE